MEPAFSLFSRVFMGGSLNRRRWITSIIRNFGGKKGAIGYTYVDEVAVPGDHRILWAHGNTGMTSEKSLIAWATPKVGNRYMLVAVYPYRQSNYERMDRKI